jgi:hypothetical protein
MPTVTAQAGDSPAERFGLHPTRTRLRLLRDVAAGNVHDDDLMHLGEAFNSAGGGRRKVTAAVAELRRVEWIELGDRQPGRKPRPWLVTDLGREVIEWANSRGVR